VKRFWVILVTLAAATAFAEENYGMPAEFNILTPEEVQVDVALHGYAGSCEGDEYTGIILEPVLIKCRNGAPGYYYVFTFTGTEPDNLDAIKGIIRLLNEEEGFYLEEITPFLNTARGNYRDYSTFGYNAWDFGSLLFKTSAIDALLFEFEIYIKIAEKCLGVSGPAKIKLYKDAPFRSGLIFSLTNEKNEEKFMWAVGYTGWVFDDDGRIKDYTGYAETSRRDITDRYHERIGQLRSTMNENSDNIERNLREWEETREKIGTIEKEDGYYRIIVPAPE
jgi:hypothetical protein